MIHRQRARGRLSARALVTLLGVALLVASGCGTGGASAQHRREADVYAAVLRTAMAGVSIGNAHPLVFVSPVESGKPFPLEVQAGVITRLAKQAQVKFVDDPAQAIDAGAQGQPVLGGGVLFNLGTVPASETAFEVSGERYLTAADRFTLRFSVRATTGGWVAEVVADQPRPSGA